MQSAPLDLQISFGSPGLRVSPATPPGARGPRSPSPPAPPGCRAARRAVLGTAQTYPSPSVRRCTPPRPPPGPPADKMYPRPVRGAEGA
eukprot:922523-Prorocentrum_minimum.AAC.1